jgi:putative protease
LKFYGFNDIRISNNLSESSLEEKPNKNLKVDNNTNIDININSIQQISNTQINLLLNIIDFNFDYTKLTNVDKLYIPLKYFLKPEFKEKMSEICKKFNTYVYMPNVLRDTCFIDFNNLVNNFSIKGFVVSAINQNPLLKKYNLELIGNYNLNVYNTHTQQALKNMGISSFCITPELNDLDTQKLINTSVLPMELMVYGKIPFMTMNYCLLGKSNKCYKECKHLCLSNQKFYIKDRMELNFRIIPDNFSTITTIYNSKTTSFDYSNFEIKNVRISILDEEPEQIQNIINTIKTSNRFEGKEFCGHFNQKEPQL